MKKSIVFGLLLCFAFSLILNLIAAYDLPLEKQTYYPGETLQMEIPDIFTSTLLKSNIGIYQVGAVHKTPVEYDLLKSQNKYYFYAVLPEKTGNYSITIENQVYSEGSAKSNSTIVKQFQIIDTNVSYLSFNPGFFYTASDFNVLIKAYNAGQSVNVEFLANGFKQNFNLGNSMTKTVYVPIINITNFTISELKINSYIVPIMVAPANTNSTINLSIETTSDLDELIEVVPAQLNAVLLKNLNYYFNFKLSNALGLKFGDINISSSNSNIILNKTLIPSFSDKQTFTVGIVSDSDFLGNITLAYKNSSIVIPVNIEVTENQSNITYNVLPINLQQTCKQLEGRICNSSLGEICNGIEEDSINGACCLAECQIKKSSSSWVWGIILLIFIGIGAWLLYQKSKSLPGQERANEIVKSRAEDYEKRVSPQENLKEVKKSLSKD